jgi:hypothetical protein
MMSALFNIFNLVSYKFYVLVIIELLNGSNIYGPSLDHCFYSLDWQEMSLIKFRPSYHKDVTRLDLLTMNTFSPNLDEQSRDFPLRSQPCYTQRPRAVAPSDRRALLSLGQGRRAEPWRFQSLLQVEHLRFMQSMQISI